ncbi:hypothetical protein Goari_020058, partial [Gossypium aridum]|nr:hypothetical protein [Gossypium aridum]
MTVEKLMDTYEVCISGLRKTQTRRRIASLKRISPANFTKEARNRVPQMVLQRIQSLNKLDVELYEYAQGIFAKQHKQAAEKLFDAVKNTRKHLHLFGWHQALGCLFVDHAICLAVHLLVCKCKAKNIETEDMNVTDYS